MTDIKKWFQPETTKKQVFDGIYPVMISQAKTYAKEVEKEKVMVQREVVELTFKTLHKEIPFPDKSKDLIVVRQLYYFDVDMHVNALNGLARACGIDNLSDTDQLEGKICIIGIMSRDWEAQNKETGEMEVKYTPQMGEGLFCYAPMASGAEIEFVATDHPNGVDKDEHRKWCNEKLAKYKSPR